MWECRIGIEGVRSVPLEERMVTSTGKELRMCALARFLTMVALYFGQNLGLGQGLWQTMGFVLYLELLIELLPVQVPSTNNIDSKVPCLITLIANIRDI